MNASREDASTSPGNDPLPGEPRVFDYVELSDVGSRGESALPGEIALAIGYNDVNQAVMMVSPGNIEDFVVGFSLSNGIVSTMDDIYDIRLTGAGDAWQADVEISSRAFWHLKDQRRQLVGTSSCGICGTEAMAQALPELKTLAPARPPASSLFNNLRERIFSAQTVARQSGAVHAALYLNPRGDVEFCREDIGRHNALDKLIGAVYRARATHHDGLVVVTSRCSLELVHKAVRADFGTLATLSAPTSLTVEWARRCNLNLIHIPHRSPPRLYSPYPATRP